MTNIEKFRQDHPEMSEFDLGFALGSTCPCDHGYPENTESCFGDDTCRQCWEKEIPKQFVSSTEPNEIVDLARATIKDSGSTTEFDTGAHRDAREGKGRCDLIPMEVMSKYIGDDGTDLVLDCIADFQKSCDTAHLYNALAYFDEKHWDNCYKMMLEVAKHYEAGADKYGADNWKRGIPAYIYIDSAIRHYLKWLRGDTDEPHDRAFVWNIMCCIWEVDYHSNGGKEG